MDLLGTMVNVATVTVVGAIVVWFTRGRFEAIDRRIDRLENRLAGTATRLDRRIDRVEARFDGLEAGLDGRFGALQSTMDAMRSDLTQVALAVGVRPRAQND